MKHIDHPKDGLTHIANGRRFATAQDVKVYAYCNEMFISYVSTNGAFTYYDLASMECEARDVWEMQNS